MLVLRSSPPSPFGRKVKIAAAALGLSDRIEIVATDTMNPDDPIRALNPLGKIPALVLEDGLVLFDSRVILEYLDHLAGGGRLIPAEPAARFAALRLQALADGLMDAALLQIYEARLREPDKRSERWLESQSGKVTRALAAIEAAPPAVETTVGAIATACALGYLDLRFEGGWRATHPGLVAWLDAFRAAVPAYDKTAPH
ncbi:glutathione S-transferase N-terminal domain-containing protein [Chenggangzhangella methanolivorans]|uniref:Glutathione S-transferase N-terminal domain-containing protein n=1 Tax=Chenggangzhangella methanolivorans TaxID=1437009 RepID=A0A9E6R6P3_9HYPH|nr:glutathione S-transferase N-terminal domain-containing protein [Chenggangzhangella methanolivorans]QZN99227.1 glutathione S-transferase N-terminal domain-containing protein [Chenggangzhangella methanolivorans]